MGLTHSSTGLNAVDNAFEIKKISPSDCVIALAGNPNVGKSTVFNNLTGMHQHTGNWPGKTVASVQGVCRTKYHEHIIVDIPGTYSLMSHSAEEEIARNFICFARPDATVVLCDATCLERNLNLVLQTIEISDRVVVCVNLLDEAERKHIRINTELLSNRLGVPVIAITALEKKSLGRLTALLDSIVDGNIQTDPISIDYGEQIEDAISRLEPLILQKTDGRINSRWLALRLLDADSSLIDEINTRLGFDIASDIEIMKAVEKEKSAMQFDITDKIVYSLVKTAEHLCDGVVIREEGYNSSDLKIDRILTSRFFGYPVMIIMLLIIFWLTIAGANYPSAALSSIFSKLGGYLTALFDAINAPHWLHGALIDGVYNVLTSVISVMLPPMAIFFPLFTLLEDSGYLPRVAYNLDKPFKKCKTCGKQSLTMCMGFGCNAAGVTGCRIIDSPRERIIAILTNSFVPCNGRFPALITIITMFFVGSIGVKAGSFTSAVMLTLLILLGIAMTFIVSRVLSMTLLRGVPSSFALELPPYRKPQIGKVIVRSIFDRTLFVLGRAAIVAAPAGLIIWLFANITIGDITLLAHIASVLDPLGKALGMDGAILLAFILGFPANEIVIPIIIMTYMQTTALGEMPGMGELHSLFIQNGWSTTTAVCVLIFILFHWPCSTTLITVYKETKSVKWTLCSAFLPTLTGMLLCFIIASISRLI